MIWAVLWVSLCLVTSFMIYVRLRNRAIPVILSYLILFLVAPSSSLLVFQSFDYINSIPILVVGHLSIVIGIFSYVLFCKSRFHVPIESRITFTKGVFLFTLICLIMVMVGNYKIYEIVLSHYSIRSLNDLNIAFNDPRLPSFGIYSRMSRIAVPMGIICLTAYAYAENKKQGRPFLVLCLIFTLTLIGVRRATFLNQIVFYVLLLLPLIRSLKEFSRYFIASLLALLLMINIFGYIQINTNKSKFDSSFISGIYDGSSYFAGNLAYSECIFYANMNIDKGSSFPFIYTIVNRAQSVDSEIKKPFCDIGNGLLFNTSPIYYDLYRDFGYIGMIATLAVMGMLLLWLYGNTRYIGIATMVAAALFFGIRENLLGQYDTLFALVIYVPLTYIMLMFSRGREHV